MTQAKLESYLQARAKPAPKPEPAPRAINPQRREAILAVAHDVFLESGYEAASMSQIAARLGGSKGTLYSYFDSKEALFQALIADNCDRTRDTVFDVPTGAALPDALQSIARAYIRLVMSDYKIRMFQIIAAEARRWPALGIQLYESGPAAAITRLSSLLAADAEAAGLAIDDSTTAAETFMTLCRGALHLRRILGIAPEPDNATIDSEAERAVTAFCRIYAA